VRRNLVPDTWTADGEGALPELGSCPHDNSCVGCRGKERAASRFSDVEFDDVAAISLVILTIILTGWRIESGRYMFYVNRAIGQR